ncbi:MAG: hypothetical protein IJQ89_08625 [Bacteroidales bacterium]|nr:hypothetical protein [Bacteroidales bacterium]
MFNAYNLTDTPILGTLLWRGRQPTAYSYDGGTARNYKISCCFEIIIVILQKN